MEGCRPSNMFRLTLFLLLLFWKEAFICLLCYDAQAWALLWSSSRNVASTAAADTRKSQSACGFSLGFPPPRRPTLQGTSLVVVRGGSSSSSSSSNDNIAATTNLGSKQKRQAIVVGGGPVGLAAALTLSNEPHCYDVIVLEQTAKAGKFDPTKAYVYGITSRGQDWMEHCCPKALTKLQQKGTAFRPMKDAAVILSDPTKPLPKTTAAASTGSTEMQAFGKVDTGGVQNYWVPRHSMIEALQELVKEQQEQAQAQHENNTAKETTVGSIQVIPSQQCESLQLNKDGMVEVVVKDTSSENKIQSFSGHLVVGADGVNSAVREFLGGRAASKQHQQESSWLTAQPNKFQVKQWNSQSSGLRMKVLQIPSNFPLTNVDGTILETDRERLYSILSVTNRSSNRLRLGLLPIKNPTNGNVRTANCITRPNHDIWNFQNGKAAKEWYRQAFPRLDWNSLVKDDAEWDRFAQAKGTTFPPCQYCTGLQISSPDERTGVVLVGDALHAFPPDLGQGINSGFADILALDRALRGNNIISGEKMNPSSSNKDSSTTLGQALQEYERVRGPETKALIRLARFGAPYQYRQSLVKDRIGHFLWTLNIVLRLFCNKLTLGLLPPPALIMSMDKKLTFRQVMRRADLTTAGWHSVVAFFVWRALDKILFAGGLGVKAVSPLQMACSVFALKLITMKF